MSDFPIRRAVIGLLAVSILLFSDGIAAQAFGPDSDCIIGERTYRIRMPAGHDGVTPAGAILFMHGYRGTAAGTMRNKSLGKAVSGLGRALIAPKSAKADWTIPGAPHQGGDEFAYFDALVEDVTSRFPIDPGRLMVTGFSAGGMMIWNLACYRSDAFAGFAPIAGTFWMPMPESCPGKPVHMIHTHGTSARIVPMAGRPIATEYHRGDAEKALAMFARDGGYGPAKPQWADGLSCKRRINADGKILELCLHPGGHFFRTGYVIRA